MLRLLLCVLLLLTLDSPVRSLRRDDYGGRVAARPQDAGILDEWAAARAQAGDVESAVTLLRAVAALAGWTPARRAAYASITLSDHDRALLANRDYGAASDALRANGQDAQALYTLAILRAPDAPDEAIALFGRAALDPAFTAKAQAASRALDRAPNAIARLRALGAALITAQEWGGAEVIFNRLAALDGTSPGTLALLALSQEALGRDASALLDLALARAPTDPTVNYAAALHWRRRGDPDRALAALGQASLADTRSPAIAAEVAAILRDGKRPSDAGAWYEWAAQLAPNEIGYAQALTAFYADERYALDSAGLDAIRRALSAFPNDPELNAIYGQILLALGNRGDARSALDRARLLDAANVRAAFYTGQLAEQLGDPQSAVLAYQQIVNAAQYNAFTDAARRALDGLLTPRAEK